MQCLIDIDYRLPYKGVMHSFNVLDAAIVSTTTSTPPVSSSSSPESTAAKKVDVMKPTVSQFALKPEK